MTVEGSPGRARRGWAIAAAVVVVVIVAGAIVVLVLARPSDSLAELRIRDDVVHVKAGGSVFTDGVEGQNLARGNVVRTDDGGQAQIDYFDGSLTRLDANTTFTIRELADAPGRRISLRVTRGRIWSRIERLTSPADRFEVRAGAAVATIRGTRIVTDCREAPTCFWLGVDGDAEVNVVTGRRLDVGADDCFRVTGEGRTRRCREEKLRELRDAWYQEMKAADGGPLPGAETTPTPTPSPSPSPRAVVEEPEATRPPVEQPPTEPPASRSPQRPAAPQEPGP